MLHPLVTCVALPFALLAQAPDLPSTPLPTIAWDAASARLIAAGGDYGRMVRLGDGRVACVYDRDRQIWIRHSPDGGEQWGEPIRVAVEPECWLTNADLLPLADGRLLYFWNERPIAAVRRGNRPAPPGQTGRPFRIRVAISTDHGETWSEPRTLYEAGESFGDGCWEPAAVQLRSGEVQVYFANEGPYRESDEQEITRLRSRDGGATWGPPERVAYRPGHRDGMPAPLVLLDGRSVVVAIEDNGLAGDRFKPVIVRVPGEGDAPPAPESGESPDRWGALAEPLDPSWYGGAPGLRRLPSGLTLLSYQESPDGSLEHSRMAVCVGDRHVRGFTNKTYPLPDATAGPQLWNSLFVRDAEVVTAVLTATIDGVRGIWAVDGRVIEAPPEP